MENTTKCCLECGRDLEQQTTKKYYTLQLCDICKKAHLAAKARNDRKRKMVKLKQV
jgi:hypothetical protein